MADLPNFNVPLHPRPLLLVAPLDWGLGHASRCIPVIHYCLNAGFEIIIAASGAQREFLKLEFPKLSYVDSPSVRVSYTKNAWLMPFAICFQAPKILMSINKENKWLLKLANEKPLTAVISDNRYGLCHPSVHSIIITHQLAIRSGLGKLADRMLQKINYRYLNRFNACWVPDSAGSLNLAGELSHPANMPLTTVHYLGALSRIKKTTADASIDLLIIISGPEPQRSLFEEKISAELRNYKGTVTIVRGLPSETEKKIIRDGCTVYNHLPAQALQSLIANAHIILGRSGFSTVMDLLPIGKKCILIPTPGQTEQIYLAQYLSAKGYCVTGNQDDFDLTTLLSQAAALELPDLSSTISNSSLETAIKSLMA